MVAWGFVPEPPHTDGPFFLWKLLIDHEHQCKGYGRRAVEQVIALIRAYGGTQLITSYVEGEGNPFGFYAKLGFVQRGDLDPEGEIMLRLSLEETRARSQVRRGAPNAAGPYAARAGASTSGDARRPEPVS